MYQTNGQVGWSRRSQRAFGLPATPSPARGKLKPVLRGPDPAGPRLKASRRGPEKTFSNAPDGAAALCQPWRDFGADSEKPPLENAVSRLRLSARPQGRIVKEGANDRRLWIEPGGAKAPWRGA